MAQRKKFYAFVHLLRAIAPLMVVWSHITWWSMYNNVSWPFFMWVHLNISNPLNIYQNFGHLGVAIFFLISGFIISTSIEREGRLEFAIKRIFRIFPALAVACVLVFFLQAGGFQTRVEAPDPLLPWYSYVAAFTFWDVFVERTMILLPVRWSLVPEFLFYASSCLFMFWFRRWPITSMLAVALAFVSVTIFSGHFSYFAYMNYFTMYIPLFMMGRSFYLHRNGQINSPMLCGLLIAFLSMIALTVELGFENDVPVLISSKFLTYPIAVVIFGIAFLINASRNYRVTAFFADISYSMYLLHVPILSATMPALVNLTGDVSVAAIISFLIMIISSTLCFRFIETPCNSLARRLVKPNSISTKSRIIGPTTPAT